MKNPMIYPDANHVPDCNDPCAPSDGVTLRDYFAIRVLQGVLSNPNTKGENGSIQDMLKIAAQVAYTAADAMLAARSIQ